MAVRHSLVLNLNYLNSIRQKDEEEKVHFQRSHCHTPDFLACCSILKIHTYSHLPYYLKPGSKHQRKNSHCGPGHRSRDVPPLTPVSLDLQRSQVGCCPLLTPSHALASRSFSGFTAGRQCEHPSSSSQAVAIRSSGTPKYRSDRRGGTGLYLARASPTLSQLLPICSFSQLN